MPLLLLRADPWSGHCEPRAGEHPPDDIGGTIRWFDRYLVQCSGRRTRVCGSWFLPNALPDTAWTPAYMIQECRRADRTDSPPNLPPSTGMGDPPGKGKQGGHANSDSPDPSLRPRDTPAGGGKRGRAGTPAPTAGKSGRRRRSPFLVAPPAGVCPSSPPSGCVPFLPPQRVCALPPPSGCVSFLPHASACSSSPPAGGIEGGRAMASCPPPQRCR
jgi:hypothetical protein